MIVFCNADRISIGGATLGSQVFYPFHTNTYKCNDTSSISNELLLNQPQLPSIELPDDLHSIRLSVTLYMVSNKLICLCRILMQCGLFSSLTSVFREVDKS